MILSMSCHRDFSRLYYTISPIMAWGFEKLPVWKPTISKLGPEDMQASYHHPRHPQIKIQRYATIKSNLYLWKFQKSPEQLMKFLPTLPFRFLSHNSSNRKGEGSSIVVDSVYSSWSRHVSRRTKIVTSGYQARHIKCRIQLRGGRERER